MNDYRPVDLLVEIDRLRDLRTDALLAGHLEDAAEITCQLDKLYAEQGAQRVRSEVLIEEVKSAH